MPWEVLFDDDCWGWFQTLEDGLRFEIGAVIERLAEDGPQVGRPYVDTLKGSNLANLKEMRIQFKGEPWRLLFAFDPKRRAVLLMGGNKAGDKRWYRKAIRLAELRYRRHLEEE